MTTNRIADGTEANRILVIRHEQCSGLGLLDAEPKAQKIPICYLDAAQGETLSEPIDSYSHLVILGGPISAYEDDLYPYLRYEFKLVEQAIEAGIPTLGICLGSQILAKVLGARVYRGEHGREAGWREIHLTDNGRKDALFQGFPASFKAFESHQDTFDLPTGCTHLAFSDMYPHQSFCYQNQVWAIQFHLEMSEQVLLDCSAIIEQEIEESQLQDVTVEQLIAEAQSHVPAVLPLATRFSQQFILARKPAMSPV